MFRLIEPHGGRLVNRIVGEEEKAELSERSQQIKRIKLNTRQISDIEMIATGALSPLEGFMGKQDYHCVVHNMRLDNGLPWTIPITLPVDKDVAEYLEVDEEIALADMNGQILAVLYLEEKFPFDKEQEASFVYGTNDTTHPGVDYLQGSGDILLGGKITVLKSPEHKQFNKYRFRPAETRKIFIDKGWRRIVGFQTRNPVHRAHEYIQKCALEIVDGLFLHPIVGATKNDDIPADVRMKCYETLISNYFPEERVFLGVNPASMRYAGPREAIFHALVRKNYGCTHFIVGRDHAGVGDYYGSFDAHYIFNDFDQEELGITPLFYDYTFYCQKCQQMASYKTCSHNGSEHVSLSGTKIRQMLSEGQALPPEFSRPEVALVLIEWANNRFDYSI